MKFTIPAVSERENPIKHLYDVVSSVANEWNFERPNRVTVSVLRPAKKYRDISFTAIDSNFDIRGHYEESSDYYWLLNCNQQYGLKQSVEITGDDRMIDVFIAVMRRYILSYAGDLLFSLDDYIKVKHINLLEFKYDNQKAGIYELMKVIARSRFNFQNIAPENIEVANTVFGIRKNQLLASYEVENDANATRLFTNELNESYGGVLFMEDKLGTISHVSAGIVGHRSLHNELFEHCLRELAAIDSDYARPAINNYLQTSTQTVESQSDDNSNSRKVRIRPMRETTRLALIKMCEARERTGNINNFSTACSNASIAVNTAKNNAPEVHANWKNEEFWQEWRENVSFMQ